MLTQPTKNPKQKLDDLDKPERMNDIPQSNKNYEHKLKH